MSTGSPAPNSSMPAPTTNSDDDIESTTPTDMAANAHATGRSSPVRRISAVIVTPARIAPTPCTAPSTPTNSTGLPSPSSTMAKKTDSLMPMASMQITVATIVARRTGWPSRCRPPLLASARKCSSERPGRGSSIRMASRAAADSRNVPASRMATAGPPNPAYSAAPASGATRRSASRTVPSDPFAWPSCSSGSIVDSSADRALENATSEAP